MPKFARVLLIPALVASLLTAAACPLLAAPPAPLQHVFVVMLENHSYDQVIGNPAMPYLNSLAQQYGLATNFYANVHPSIGNYFMATAGRIPTTDDGWQGVVDDDNIAQELARAGKSWKVYAQKLPSSGYTGNDVYPYCKHHNPFAYFRSVRDDRRQADNMVDYAQIWKDSEANNLPNYAFLVPDKQNDAHDCPWKIKKCSDDDKLAAADRWLKENIGPLVSNPAFMQNGLIIIDWDEAVESDKAHGGGHVAVVMVGGHVPRGTRSDEFYQQQSVLATSLDALGVSARPGESAGAPVMREFQGK